MSAKRAAVVGAALSDCGRVDDKTPFDLHHQAAARALADAGPAVSGRLAFERARLTPGDVDICQFYDAFTPMVLLTFEALGFCKPGEAGGYLEGGTMRMDGRMPKNTDGGGLSSCHPGMRGIFLLVEAVRQLRGEAGPRQVPDARICCVNGTGGWFSSASTILLGVD